MEGNYTVRVRKFMTNKLLHRRQMILDVYHGQALSSGTLVPSVSKADLKERVAKMYKVRPDQVMLFGFQTSFGGGRSSGFCLIYDHKDFMAKLEPKWRLRRSKIIEPKEPKNRRSIKELKNKKKKFRGKQKTAATLTKKK